MLKSKDVRLICYIIMGIAYVLAFVLCIFGCLTFSAGKVASGIVLILIGVLIPLIISVALYPVFALSLIESNTAETNYNLERIIELLENKSTSAPSQQTAPEPEENIPSEVDEYLNDELAKFKKGKNQVGL